MQVLDWSRTALDFKCPDGSEALTFDITASYYVCKDDVF